MIKNTVRRPVKRAMVAPSARQDVVDLAKQNNRNRKRSLVRHFFSIMLHRKWLILMTTLLTILILFVSVFLAKPENITLDSVLLTGILAGMFLGALIATYYEWRKSLLISVSELEQATGYPVIGVIPKVKRGELYLAREVKEQPHSHLAEAYRVTATMLLHRRREKNDNLLLVTSLDLDDGKSVTAANLAYSLAELDAKILIVDGDLRQPSVHKKIGVQNKFGLVNYLLGRKNIASVTQQAPTMPKLYVITAGSAMKFSPVNLLSQNRMASFLINARKYFDYVIIDAPPLKGFADTLLLHSLATSTVVVVPEKTADVEEINKNLELLVRIKPSLIGLIKVRARRDIVSKEYYKNYCQDSLPMKFKGKKSQKINLGTRKH